MCSSLLKMISNFEKLKKQEAIKVLSDLHNKGDFDFLLKLAKRFVEKYPGNVNGLNILAIANKRLGNFYKAKEIFEFIIKQSNKPQAFLFSNLANLFFDLGKIDDSIVNHKKALEIEPNNLNSISGMGLSLSEKGNEEEAVKWFKKSYKINPIDDGINFNLATSLRKLRKFDEAAFHYSKSKKRLSKSFQLECIYQSSSKSTSDFYDLADELNAMPLDPLAACLTKHASIRYSKEDKYSFCSEPFKMIKKYSLFEDNSIDKNIIDDFLEEVEQSKISMKHQSLLNRGIQSAGNLFLLESPAIIKMKEVIHEKIKIYKDEFSESDDGFLKKWPNEFIIHGWLVVINDGGNLKPHMHKEGWLSSSIYLKRPNKKSDNDGDLMFSLHGADYETDGISFPEKIYEINEGDIVMFPSSLFHSTIPFKSNKKRITLAFDVIPIN